MTYNTSNPKNENTTNISIYLIKKNLKSLEEKFDDFRKEDIKESRRYTTYASTIIGVGIAIISIGLGVSGAFQHLSLWNITDYSRKSIDDMKKNFSELEKNTKERMDLYLGTRNISGYQIVSYDERDKTKITALLTDIQRKYDDISIYNVGIIVPIKIIAEGEALGELVGVTFRVSGDLANILSIQGKDTVLSQMKVVTTLNYFGLKDVFFSKKVPVGFSFTIAGLSNKCEDFSLIKERYKNEILGKLYITPIIKNYAGEYREDTFDVSVDSARLDISCNKPK